MKKIKYKENKNNALLTLCEIKKNGWHVGCFYCTEKCENFISHDRENQIIRCKGAN